MSQKVYFDAVNNKHAFDVSGVKDEAAVKAEFGLDASTQIIEIDESFESAEIVGGNLQKFDRVAREATTTTARENARQGRVTAILAKMNAGRTGPALTEEDLFDIGLSQK